MSCFKGGQFYVIPSFDDMPVGTAQCILEHCKIGVHGTTGFHFSPSFLIVRCFLLVSEVQSVCENVALPFVTPLHMEISIHLSQENAGIFYGILLLQNDLEQFLPTLLVQQPINQSIRHPTSPFVGEEDL